MFECQLSTEIVKIFIAIIAVEAITEIIVDSKIFLPLRNYIAKKAMPDIPTGRNTIFNFLHDLISCGYCTSVWVSSFVMTLLVISGTKIFYPVINEIILVFFIHRMSNLFHVLYQLTLRGRVNTLDIELKIKDESNVDI